MLFPFLSSLGYDVSNPLEIIPEYHADFSDVKADKADLCIIIDNQPSIIIELKKLGTKFDTKHRRQLAQYFHWVQSINLAILTDGILYEFYSDLNNHNQMDEKPFFTINLHDLNDDDIQFLEMITKQSFNINNITEFANKMNITKILFNQINENHENLEMNISGLKCDNCDYRDDSVPLSDYESSINKPCPQCGESLLTQEDYDSVMQMVQAVEMINGFSEADLEKIAGNLSSEEIDAALDYKNVSNLSKYIKQK